MNKIHSPSSFDGGHFKKKIFKKQKRIKKIKNLVKYNIIM